MSWKAIVGNETSGCSVAAPFPAQKRTEMGWTTGVMGQRQTPAGDPTNQSLVTQHCFLKPSLRAWLEQKKKWQKEMLSYRSLNANRYCTHLHLEPSSELETQSREVGHGRALLRCLVTDLFAKGREGQLAGRDAKWEIYFCLKLVWFFCFLLSENVNLIDKVFCTGSKTKALSHPQTHNFLLIEIPSLITSCCKWSSYDH